MYCWLNPFWVTFIEKQLHLYLGSFSIQRPEIAPKHLSCEKLHILCKYFLMYLFQVYRWWISLSLIYFHHFAILWHLNWSYYFRFIWTLFDLDFVWFGKLHLFYLDWKSNDWFLDEIQHSIKIGWSGNTLSESRGEWAEIFSSKMRKSCHRLSCIF